MNIFRKIKSINFTIVDVFKKLGINNPTQEQLNFMQKFLKDLGVNNVRIAINDKVKEQDVPYLCSTTNALKFKTGVPVLTKRETECLGYLSHGKNRKEIASLIGLSPRTVDTHLEKARNKLGCFTNSELIDIWWKSQDTE